MSRRALVAAAAFALTLAIAPSAAQAQAQANPLAIMVVPAQQLGTAAKGLQVELASGETANARAADDSFDPTDTAATLAKAGRVSGYTLLYGDPGLTALLQGRGLVDLGTSVDLFKTQKQAGSYQLKTFQDLRAAVRHNLGGVVVEQATPFEVTSLGPNAVGVRTVQRIGAKRLYVTTIDFQVDRLLCEAEVTRADANRADAQATAIARTFLSRILAYAQNQLNAKPVTLPRPQGLATPQPGAPDLEAMALTAKSLKGKAGVFQQGFAADVNAIVSYSREFRFDPKSGRFLLQNRLSLQRSRREAAGRMVLLRAALTGPEAADTIAQQFLGEAATSKAHATLDGSRGLGIGEESFATSVTLDTPSGRTRVVFAYLRRQRVLGLVVLAGKPASLKLDSVAPYVQALDGRIKAAFGKSGLAA